MTHAEAVSTLATERYLLDDMSEQEREAFEAHYFACVDCAGDVRAAFKMRDGATDGLLGRATLARPAFAVAQARTPIHIKRPWFTSVAVPWAVAATLAVAVAYQASRPAPESARGADEIAALTPTLLRPASRGAAPIVTGAGGHIAVALDLDLDSQSAPELAYALRTADGRNLLTGRARAPMAGTPLVLVIPSFTLTEQQQYSLAVWHATRPDGPLGTFTFTAGTSR